MSKFKAAPFRTPNECCGTYGGHSRNCKVGIELINKREGDAVRFNENRFLVVNWKLPLWYIRKEFAKLLARRCSGCGKTDSECNCTDI